jgi:hypothetical protein
VAQIGDASAEDDPRDAVGVALGIERGDAVVVDGGADAGAGVEGCETVRVAGHAIPIHQFIATIAKRTQRKTVARAITSDPSRAAEPSARSRRAEP